MWDATEWRESKSLVIWATERTSFYLGSYQKNVWAGKHDCGAVVELSSLELIICTDKEILVHDNIASIKHVR